MDPGASLVKVAVVQHDIAWEDRDATLARIEPMVTAAFADGARLVVLPEMFAVGFSMAPERVAEPPDGPTTAWLAEQAKRAGAWICGSLPEQAHDRPRNVFALAGPDGFVERYAKLHPFTYAGEHEHYQAGDEVVTLDVEGVRLTPFVCYDLRFADEFWGAAADTDLYVVVANWPATRAHHWRSLLVARAIENQAYVIGCNRVGTGGGLDYAGGSCIVDPMGGSTDAGDGEATITGDVDRAALAETRRRFPFLADRRRHTAVR